MDLTQIEYTKTSTRPFSELVHAVEESAAKRNFRTLHIHDVQGTLAEKGFDIEPYSIIEVCNARYAFEAISAFPAVGMLLPCRIVIYSSGGTNFVTLMKPTAMQRILPQADLASLPDVVEKALVEVVDEVTAQKDS